MYSTTINFFKTNNILRIFENKIHSNKIPVFSYFGSNWGDNLSTVITSMLSNKSVFIRKYSTGYSYYVIGSILQEAQSDSIIWGAGFIAEDCLVKYSPACIHAVRGPLSRKKYLDVSIDCPEIYGDPAILLPLFYKPVIEKKYRIGIIPHFIDKGHPALASISLNNDIKILDIQGGIFKFVDQVLSCEVIISTSLHGLICAESYGIPTIRATLGDKIIGGSFKFDDYRLGIGGEKYKILDLTVENIKLNSIISSATLHNVSVAQANLLKSCPFLESNKLKLKDS